MAEVMVSQVKSDRITWAVDVSVVLPVHNAEEWLDECLQSVCDQTFKGSMELSVYNDCSSDLSGDILETWRPRFALKHISMVVSSHSEGGPKGVGFAKNTAIKQSCGEFLCFVDADDVMMPERVSRQYVAAKERPSTIIGSQFYRLPEGSTERYTAWANGLSPEQLYSQVYTSHGPTVIMPTWFCARIDFDRVGQFDESGKGTPEDLIYFYKHLRCGRRVFRVDDVLLMYRYHPKAATFSVSEETIWTLRVKEIETRVLSQWPKFTIWNAGKQGRKFYRSISKEYQKRVISFCDVDEKKIALGFYTYEDSEDRPKPRIPIVHFTKACGPFILCVKQSLTGGSFEENLKMLNITEGMHYFHFN